jgi:hypothetical protein
VQLAPFFSGLSNLYLPPYIVIIAANFTPVHKLAAAYLGARFMCVCVFLWQSRALDLHAGAYTINGAGETTAGGTYCGGARKNARARRRRCYILCGVARSLAHAARHRTTKPNFCGFLREIAPQEELIRSVCCSLRFGFARSLSLSV